MSEGSKALSWPVQVVFRFVLTIGLVWLLSINLEQYFFLTGGLIAYIIIGALLTLMNMIIRPLLHIIFAPFHLIFGLIATIIMNWLFLWLILQITGQMDPKILLFSINGGVGGWFIVAIVLGLANWLMKHLLKA